jgi:hypothetical protein
MGTTALPTPSTFDLEAIRARADAAIPGPWTFELCHGCDSRGRLDVSVQAHGAEVPIAMWDDGDKDMGYYHEPTAEFIAAAREDVPALLVEVARLRNALNELRALRDAEASGDLGASAGVGASMRA